MQTLLYLELPELLQGSDEIMLNLISAAVVIMGRKKEQEGEKSKKKNHRSQLDSTNKHCPCRL